MRFRIIATRVIALWLAFCSLEAAAEDSRPAKDPSKTNVLAADGDKNNPVYFCIQFTRITRNEVAGFINELDNAPEDIDEFLARPVCQPGNYGQSVKGPLLHLILDNPVGREDFAAVFFKYYSIKRKNTDQWLKVINSKNTLGETFLDYFETRRMDSNGYTTEEYLAAENSVKAWACKHGALYEKYKRKYSCPD